MKDHIVCGSVQHLSVMTGEKPLLLLVGIYLLNTSLYPEIFFLSDNGGPIGGGAPNGSRNTPLKGRRVTQGRVGEILRELEEDRLLENTIIWFWSDHGC